MDKIVDETTSKDIIVSRDQLMAGLAVFEDWRAAPLGINFGELVENIYRAMRSSEPHTVTFRPAPETVVVPVAEAPTFQTVAASIEPVPVETPIAPVTLPSEPKPSGPPFRTTPIAPTVIKTEKENVKTESGNPAIPC